jgi:hypothetical protein
MLQAYRMMARTAASPASPVVAIIIPTYKHAALMAEAVRSALGQTAPFDIAVVIVDDGCPLVETTLVALALAEADARVTYLQQANGGLSAARNRGIEHVLTEMPTVEAVYFLDADNRMSPTTLASSLALLDPSAGVGWVYPHIDRFGLAGASNHAGPYSRLLHIAYDNISEAGSLVARAVLETGLRFDETMRLGGEDWDFWLGALERGFGGRHDPFAGFEYRRRPESMISVTRREIGQVRQQLRERHPELDRYSRLLALEQEEAPRFLLLAPDCEAAQAFSDPSHQHRTMERAAWLDAFAAQLQEPETHGLPPIVLWAEPETLVALQEMGLVWSLLSRIERQLDAGRQVCLCVEREARMIAVKLDDNDGEGAGSDPVHLVATRLDHLLPAGRASQSRQEGVVTIRVSGPFATMPQPSVVACEVTACFRRLVEPLCAETRARWSWRTPHFPTSQDRSKLVARHLRLSCPIPRIADDKRPQLAIVVDAVDRTAHGLAPTSLARALGLSDCDVHLHVLSGDRIALDEAAAAFYASINFLGRAEPPVQAREAATVTDGSSIAGFLAGMDVVVNAGASLLHAHAGELRRRGQRYVSLIEEVGRSAFGRPVGHANLALAFEHAHDSFLAGSHAVRSWLRAMGVPRERIVLVVAAG